MIPSALIARLKMLAESTIQSTEPIRPLRPDPPPLNPGDRIRAFIQTVLPDGHFRAEIAGRPLTLSLPMPAKPGDQLDLVITGRTGDTANGSERSTITARMAEPSPASTPSPQLSRTAQLISSLLTGADAKPIPLAQGAALMPQASTDPGQIASVLRDAVSRSGMFYEAHQAQWVAGRSKVDDLLREPQAKLPPGTTLALPARGETLASREQQATTSLHVYGKQSTANTDSGPGHEVSAILHKQLDALATQQLSWQVHLWPGQQLDWEIDAPIEREAGGAGADLPEWRTSLRLTLPRLGAVSAELAISGDRVSLRLLADDVEHATQLMLARPALAGALEAAGLQLTQATVDHHD